MRSKYGNQKTTVYGITFDSKKEAERYLVLRSLEQQGLITDLQRQVKYVLLPTQKIDGETVEKALSYVADFQYKRNGEIVVEDVKGMRTQVYKIKRKLMLWFYDIQITEV